jgi:serine/threonine protein phosphatase PrpC
MGEVAAGNRRKPRRPRAACPPPPSALGDFAFKHPHPLLSPEPAVRSVALTPADSLLLMATDGVTDVVSDDDALGLALDAVTRVGRGCE